MENDIVFNENATIVLHLHIVFIFCFQPSTRKQWERLKTVKTSGNLLFACQDNLNSLWLLLLCFQKFAFSVKMIRLHDNHNIITISFSNLFTLETILKSYRFQLRRSSFFLLFLCRWKVKTQIKVCGLDEKDMKTCSCRA